MLPATMQIYRYLARSYDRASIRRIVASQEASARDEKIAHASRRSSRAFSRTLLPVSQRVRSSKETFLPKNSDRLLNDSPLLIAVVARSWRTRSLRGRRGVERRIESANKSIRSGSDTAGFPEIKISPGRGDYKLE